MKKLNYFLAFLFIVATFASCSKEDGPEIDPLGAKKKKQVVTEMTMSSPMSSIEEVTPYIIPGENRGGNRTCAEVGMAFMNDAEYFALCGDKIDYDEDMGDWDGEFPSGLNVNVEGVFVSFDIDGCLEINGKYYKVGGVIVKGSNAANVYFYEDGTTADAGLAAPNGNRMVSNLTFCFVECEPPEDLIIALKVWYWDGEDYTYALSDGNLLFDANWCNTLGYNEYPTITEFDLLEKFSNIRVGNVTIETDGSVNVNVTDGRIIDKAYVYIGTIEDLENYNLNLSGCPDYRNSDIWLVNEDDGQSQVFYP